MANEDIRKTPTIGAKPVKHGRWVALKSKLLADPRMKCSVCGKAYIPLTNWNDCPNCGAIMDLE